MPRNEPMDRRRDLSGWVLTPVLTLVLGPALAGSIGILMVTLSSLGSTPPACEGVPADNRCEEVTLGLLGAHGVLFGSLWLLLWLTPWWRGLRAARIVLAVVACGVLVAVPLRLGGVG